MDNHDSHQVTNYRAESITGFLKCNKVHWYEFNTAADSWKHLSGRGEISSFSSFSTWRGLRAGRNNLSWFLHEHCHGEPRTHRDIDTVQKPEVKENLLLQVGHS